MGRFLQLVGFVFALLAAIIVGLPVADAQTQSGRGVVMDSGNRAVENACRMRINDLRISIQDLTKDIEDIRDCSAAGGFPMRSGNNILCRPAVLGHHQLVDSNLAVQFFTNGGWGTKGNMKGNPGDPGRDVRCDQCTGTWVDPPPSCPPGFSGNYQANRVCDNGLCCGEGGSVSICCSNGAPCVSCDDWEVDYAYCGTLGVNIVSGGRCPSGNCCGAPPEAEVCPGECTEGYWTYAIEWSNQCENGVEEGTCRRCDGQEVECSYCGGQCTRTCTEPCTYNWHVVNGHQNDGWGSCSNTCGTGTQTRTVRCQCGTDNVSDSLCLANVGTKPATSQSCTQHTYSFAWTGCINGQNQEQCLRCGDGQISSNCVADCGRACGSTTAGCANNCSWSYEPGWGPGGPAGSGMIYTICGDQYIKNGKVVGDWTPPACTAANSGDQYFCTDETAYGEVYWTQPYRCECN